MDTRRWQDVCALFERIRRAPPEAQAAMLRDAGALREEVEDLLRYHAMDDGPLAGGADALPAGTVLHDHTIEARLGSGGMGAVYRARGPGGETVALKVLHPHLRAEREVVARFRREARLGMRIAHPNVVRTLSLAAEDAMVLELVEGQTLADLAREQGRLPEELCRHLGREIAVGLVAIHAAGVVHRDLKPGNVLITPANTVKLTDLGIALPDAATQQLSLTGQFLGTLSYCAPEQFSEGGAAVDGRADLYALGILLYELAAGEHPFPRGDLPSLMRAHLEEVPPRLGARNPQVSPFFEEVVHDLIAKQPAARIPDAERLAQILEEGEAGAWWAERTRAIRERTRRPLRRIRVPRQTAVVGREAELQRLETRFAAALEGRPQSVLVLGEAGVGKSRLLDEFALRIDARESGADIAVATYGPGGGASGAGALRGALLDLLGEDRLEARLRALLPSTPHLVPALAAHLRGDAPSPNTPPLDPDLRRRALVRLVQALSKERPLLLVVEDLHFAAEEGRTLFAALADAEEDGAFLLVGTARPGLPAAWRAALDRRPRFEALTLDRLGPKELTHLLIEAFDSRVVAERLALAVAEKSDGNPYFALEIVGELKRLGLLRRDGDGRWTTTGPLRDIRVPDTVKDLLRARVEDLSEAEQEILDVAACVGAGFDPHLVAAALGADLIPVLRALGRLERGEGLVRSRGDRFLFDHHQIQEVLYERLSAPLRRAYHAAIGRVLAARAGDAPVEGEDAWVLCEHRARAGDVAGAEECRGPAFAHLGRHFLHDDAIRLATRLLDEAGALPVAARVGLLLARSGHHRVQGAAAEAETDAREACRLAEDDGDVHLRMRTASDYAWICLQRGRTAEARAVYAAFSELAASVGNERAVASALGNTAGTWYVERDYARAIEMMHRYREAVERLGDPRGILAACGNLCEYNLCLRRFDEALLWGRRYSAQVEEVGDDADRIGAEHRLALIHAMRHEPEAATAHFERALGLLAGVGHVHVEATVRGNYANFLREHWRLEEAREQLEQARRFARDVGEGSAEFFAVANLARVAAWLDRRHEAEALLLEARTLAERSDRAGGQLASWGAIASAVHEAHGDREKALAALADAVPEDRPPNPDVVAARVTRVLLLRRAKRADEARPLAERALEEARRIEDHRWVPLLLALLGRVEEARRLAAEEADTEEPLLRLTFLHALVEEGDDAAREEGRREARAWLDTVPERHRDRARRHLPVVGALLEA